MNARQLGTILGYVHNPRQGWIKSSDGEWFWFHSCQFRSAIWPPENGMQVTFEVGEALRRDKWPMALEVTLIQ